MFSALKKKCGLQLALQRLELRFDQPRLEPRFADLAAAQLARRAQRVVRGDDAPVEEHLPLERVEQRPGQERAEASGRPSSVSWPATVSTPSLKPAFSAEWMDAKTRLAQT